MICKNALIRVNYPVKDSPFPMYANQHSGCMFCDDVFKKIVELPPTTEKSVDDNKDENATTNPENSSENVEKPQKTKEGEIIVKKKKKK